jgi:protein-S-isoprenylcysteine O-methyltransferase Ste14
MWGWAALYTLLVVVLFVRVRDPRAPVPLPAVPGRDEPLRLISIHHGLFYALLVVVVPLEAAITGGAPGGRAAGALAFAAGVALYRWSVAQHGGALSPFVAPHPAGRLVTEGPYRWLRHPMYLGQLAIAVGAPLTLGCRFALAVSFAAALVLVARVRLEENALARTYPDYGDYRRRAKRLIPFVF